MENLKESAVRPNQAQSDIAELVQQAQRGSLPAFDALVRSYQKMAIGYAFFLLGSSLHSEDAAQDAFVEAFQNLPALREAKAFPRWLRLLVKKHCDRFTRSRPAFVPLDSLCEQSSTGSLEQEALRRETQDRVRRLVHDLPATERKVVTLYYLSDRSCPEIAAFLGVPVSTVKNRLLTARKRLRERMAPFMEIEQTASVPADSGFRERIFGRLYEEYKEQLKKNPHTVDRSLLTRARENLLETIATTGPVDWETAWHGHHVFWKLGDIESAIALLERGLLNPLAPTEEAYSRWRRSQLMASLSDSGFDQQRRLSRKNGETDANIDDRIVVENPIFVRWVQVQASQNQIALPWYGFDRMSDACLPVWAMDGFRIAEAYVRANAFPVYEELAKEILTACPKVPETRAARFDVLSALVAQRAKMGRKQDALATVEQIRALGDEEPVHYRNPLWALEAEKCLPKS